MTNRARQASPASALEPSSHTHSALGHVRVLRAVGRGHSRPDCSCVKLATWLHVRQLDPLTAVPRACAVGCWLGRKVSTLCNFATKRAEVGVRSRVAVRGCRSRRSTCTGTVHKCGNRRQRTAVAPCLRWTY